MTPPPAPSHRVLKVRAINCSGLTPNEGSSLPSTTPTARVISTCKDDQGQRYGNDQDQRFPSAHCADAGWKQRCKYGN